MNELINIMADDMSIRPYTNEPIESFGYRVIYSALGLWCLKSALSEKEIRKELARTHRASCYMTCLKNILSCVRWQNIMCILQEIPI